MYWPRVFSWVDRLGKQNFWVRPRERFSEFRKYRAGVSFYDYFGVDPTTSSFPLKFIRFPLKIIALRTNTPNLTSGRKKIFKWGRNGFLLIFERKLSKEFDLADLLFVLALAVSGVNSINCATKTELCSFSTHTLQYTAVQLQHMCEHSYKSFDHYFSIFSSQALYVI